MPIASFPLEGDGIAGLRRPTVRAHSAGSGSGRGPAGAAPARPLWPCRVGCSCREAATGDPRAFETSAWPRSKSPGLSAMPGAASGNRPRTYALRGESGACAMCSHRSMASSQSTGQCRGHARGLPEWLPRRLTGSHAFQVCHGAEGGVRGHEVELVQPTAGSASSRDRDGSLRSPSCGPSTRSLRAGPRTSRRST